MTLDNSRLTSEEAPAEWPIASPADGPQGETLTQRFLRYCEENPDARECRVYDI